MENDPCSDDNYKDLNYGDRKVSYISSNDDKCDKDHLANEWDYWYKVSGNAADALATVTVPAEKACGTYTQLYLHGSHPTSSEKARSQEQFAPVQKIMLAKMLRPLRL